MGGGMVGPLVTRGHRVLAHDASPRAVTRAVTAGAEAATGSAEVGAAAGVVLLSLPRPADVETVVAGPDGLLSRPAEGLVVVDTSTVDPGTTRRLAHRAAAVGVGYLDAPILGRPDACGAWTLPVGGEPAALEIARPVLDALARSIVHVGPSGAGNAIKLLNQLMFGAINAITAEVFAVAPLAGVSPRLFYETVAASEAATVSPLFRQLGAKIVERNFAPVFTLDLLRKDHDLAMEMIAAARAAALAGNAVAVLNRLGGAAGYGNEDTSALVKVYEALVGGGEPDPA